MLSTQRLLGAWTLWGATLAIFIPSCSARLPNWQAGQTEEGNSVRSLNMIAKSKREEEGKGVDPASTKLINRRKDLILQQREELCCPLVTLQTMWNSSGAMVRSVLQASVAPRLCADCRVTTLWHSIQESEVGWDDANVRWLQIFQRTVWQMCSTAPGSC